MAHGEENIVTEEQIAALKQEAADLKAERASLKKALDDREADNKTARDKAKALQAELDEAKALLPTEDAVILTGDDAKAWTAYAELGTPDVLKVKIDDYDRAATEARALKRRALVDTAARDPKDETAYRFKPTVLDRLLADATLSQTDKGFTVKVGDTEKPLEKWLEEDQTDFLPAITVEPTGTRAPKQAGARSNPVTQTIEEAAAAKAARGEYHA